MSQQAKELIARAKAENWKRLDLGNCGLTDLETQVPQLFELEQLEELVLSNKSSKPRKDYGKQWGIININSIKLLLNIKYLDLSYNQITNIDCLQKLIHLKWLSLKNNYITDISALKHLNKLSWLEIQNNQVVDISPLASLYERSCPIAVYGNPLITPPYQLIKEGRKSILNWFKQKEEQGTINLYEAKMILVGEAGTGKTTLRKKLLDANYAVPNRYDEINSTHAIEITPQVPFTFEPQDIMSNIWDFGGQHNYYSTHRYFLTEWAFYILVVDERKENTRFEYWFQIIDLLAKEPNGQQVPILVLYNRRSGKPLKYIDLDFYRQKFPGLAIDSIEVDFSETDWGSERLRKTIGQNLGKLHHIGTTIPALWLPIRQQLEQIHTYKRENYIERSRFFEICRQHGLQNTEDALYLSRFLHRIGIVLHYQEDSDVLARTVILNPDWAVDAIYAALSDREKIKAGCFQFQKEWLINYWKTKNYDLDNYEVFLNLMFKNRFEIAYSRKDSTGTEWVIVPELLPAVPPHYETDKENPLTFQYEYEFMPEGLLTHFIVRMSEFISENVQGEQLVWKNGVVFTYKQNTFAEVRRLDLEGNRKIKFEIRLWGNHKEDLLKKIREEFETVNNRFSENLKPGELIPCICKKCKKSSTPEYFNLKKLIDFEERGKTKKECPSSGDDVPLSELLKSYDREASRIRWEDEKESMQKELAHLNREKIALENVLDNKGYLLIPATLNSIKKAIQSFEEKDYLDVAIALSTKIEHIANQLLSVNGQNSQSYRGLEDKLKELKSLNVIKEDLQVRINVTARNKLLHGNLVPDDINTCKNLAQDCMLQLSELIELLK